jgi:hypothetical protein
LEVSGNETFYELGDRLVRFIAFKAMAFRQSEKAWAHVRDVEEASFRSRPIVLGDEPFEFERHVIAGESAEFLR